MTKYNNPKTGKTVTANNRKEAKAKLETKPAIKVKPTIKVKKKEVE
jgi:hypothetical protein